MLEDLSIKDFALIDSANVEFNGGFTVLSGETGAGKSLLIGALTFLLGGKAGVLAENPTDYAGTDSSSELGKYAWYFSNSGDKTHEVKINKVADTDSANSLGLYDMSGNVYEWCWDWYDDNNTPSITSETPAAGVSSGSSRVLRGGCWCNYANYLYSVACRDNINPNTYCNFIGFRVVRTAN